MGRPEGITRAAAYLRVSTDKQDPGVQLDEIWEYLARRGWELWATYGDIASGAREDRPDFRRLLADAAKQKLDVVVVQRFDRAARSVKQLVEFSGLGHWGNRWDGLAAESTPNRCSRS